MNRSELLRALRRSALGYPEAREGIACEGTPIEKRTFKARDKAFLFLGATDAMVKLGASLAEATGLAAKEPGRYRAGAGGWVKVTFTDDDGPPLDLLERWIDESYRLLAPRSLAASIPARGRSTGDSKGTVKMSVPKKEARGKGAKRKATGR